MWDGSHTVWSDGNNGDLVDYWSGGHHFQIRPGTEIDAEQVYAALGEFLRTHARPECVTWRELPRPVIDPFATGTIDAHQAEDIPGRLHQAAETEPGRAWLVNVGEPGTVTHRNLTIGVRGDRGALVWNDPLDQVETVPTHGLNTEPVEYTLARLVPRVMPPGAEVPLDDALAAVAEYVRTGQRPTCIEWRTTEASRSPSSRGSRVATHAYTGQSMTNIGSVLDSVTVNVRALPTGTDIPALVRDAARTSDPDWGMSWVLTASDTGLPQLMVGVRGEVGALACTRPMR